jgi:2-dehydro-3-deoxyphosphogluconate aldolase/(4S)-4-hydroxy-2-oxoglutarate aldolase
MNKTETLDRILDVGLVPVFRASSGEEALAGSGRDSRGRDPIAEITMTVPGAVRVIEEVAARSAPTYSWAQAPCSTLRPARACILAERSSS